MVVLEGKLVLVLFWHLYPHGGLADPAALGPVGFLQVSSAVSMKTSLTEVLALLMLTLIVQKPAEVLVPGVVELTGLLSQQQVDVGHVGRLFAEVMAYDTLIPAEDIDGKVIPFLNTWDMGNGCGGINALEVESILCGILAWPVNTVRSRNES